MTTTTPTANGKAAFYSDPSARPAVSAFIAGSIPAEMRAERRWVLWRLEWVEDKKGGGKWSKIPHRSNGRKASSTDPKTWTTFQQAASAYESGGFDGIGFVLGDGWCGVDLDDVAHEQAPPPGKVAIFPTYQIDDAVAEIIARLGTYTEFGPSMTGVKAFGRGTWRGDWHRKQLPGGGEIEVYSEGRYFCVTGVPVGGTSGEVADVQTALDELAARFAESTNTEPPKSSRFKVTADGTADDDALVRKASAASNGAKFARLWAGDATDYGGDDSRADSALCFLLAFWCDRDAGRIDRLFRQSGLMRDKWDEKRGATTYGERTVAEAVKLTRETYRGNGHSPPEPATTAEGGDPEKAPAESAPPAPEPEWPEPMADEAFHGPAGELTRLIEPATEADPAGVLLQVLVGAGSLFGRHRYCEVEADRHYPNENVVLVGRTARGRKGTSWGRVHHTLKAADEGWADNRVLSGLSSGEGLIWAVRDPIVTREKFKEKGSVRFEDVESDPGVADKRLLVMEPEFANVLKQTERQGNTLSVVVRDAFDRGKLSTLTKNSPAKATGAHISIVGHITDEEFRRYLTATETANGFANRFMLCCVRRSKELPDGGRVDERELAAVGSEIRRAAEFAGTQGRVGRDEAAREVWRTIYPALTADRPGLIGNLLARAEAHVLRLSLIYALLDRSPVVRPEHLAAAVAVWDYCDRSARYVFGDALGDPLADDLLRLIRGCKVGLTRNDICNYLGRNVPSGRVEQALGLLLRHGLAHPARVATGGRPAEKWFAGRQQGT